MVRGAGTGAALRAFIFSELAEGQPYSVGFRPEVQILVDSSARSADFLDLFSTALAHMDTMATLFRKDLRGLRGKP